VTAGGFHADLGSRADGFRQGYVAALDWVLDEFGSSQLDDLSRTKIAAIIKRSSR
jgi:hypothetical protein